MAPPKTIGPGEVHAALERLAAAIEARHPSAAGLIVLGIANGGVPVARRLAARLGIARVGCLDISFHRDDLGRHPVPKEFSPTVLPGDVNGAEVLLVDDVLFTGRTVKAALDELFDHGRPARVEFAVLVDRGCRRLPIAADYTGTALAAPPEKVVAVVLGDDPGRDRIEIRPSKAPPRRAPAPR